MELNTDIKNWPLDLLLDYVLKIYHRGAREMMPEIEGLMSQVIENDRAHHADLHKVQELFSASVCDLNAHFQKEENILFPYVVEMFKSVADGVQPQPMHCGTVSHPIAVMMSDHEGETLRYDEIVRLTDDYTAPGDASAEYRLLMKYLKQFHQALLEHIYLENEIIFPRAISFESKYVGG